MDTFGNRVRTLTLKDLTANGDFVAFGEFEFLAGFPTSRINYDKMKNCFNKARKKWGSSDIEPVTLSTFFRKVKKGSKNY